MNSAYLLISDKDLTVLERRLGTAHQLCKRARCALDDLHDPLLAEYRSAAGGQAAEGELEVDANAIVSKGDDDGAYVMAWLWVSDEDAGLVGGAS
jgi:hypothetical protein